MPPVDLPEAERDVPVKRPQETSGGVVFVNKTTGWLVALLLLVLLGSVAYVGVGVFTRELQFDRLRMDVRQIKVEIELLRAKQLELERRQVQLETALESVRER